MQRTKSLGNLHYQQIPGIFPRWRVAGSSRRLSACEADLIKLQEVSDSKIHLQNKKDRHEAYLMLKILKNPFAIRFTMKRIESAKKARLHKMENDPDWEDA